MATSMSSTAGKMLFVICFILSSSNAFAVWPFCSKSRAIRQSCCPAAYPQSTSIECEITCSRAVAERPNDCSESMTCCSSRDEHQNCGLAALHEGRLIGNVTVFAFTCNRGALNGGVAKIDTLHEQQGAQLIAAGRSLIRGRTYTVDHSDCVIVFGYQTRAGNFDWITIFQVRNTGQGRPHGWIRVDRSPEQINGDAEGTYEFPSRIKLHWREDDSVRNRMYISFS